jgi:hypothetical protein
MLLMAFAICSVLPVACIFAGHWFPWPVAIGRKLRRLEAYAIGVLIILVPPSVAIVLADQTLSAYAGLGLVWASCLSAGAATLLAWGIDALFEHIHSLRDQVDRVEFRS